MGRWFLFRYLSPTYLRLYARLLKDGRVPLLPKLGVGLSLVYLIFPRDMLPDWIAFLGWVDDVAVLVLALMYLVRSSPPAVVAEHLRSLGQGGRG
ncbi:MAG: DUF1232 domain-containing protein [Deltaproteobacteria bacterium]|nr:DUF1232 domain-containing protein [Deltaproteobacteria bacterium]